MFTYPLGNWTLAFDRAYRVVRDDTTAVVLDDDRTALVLVSLTEAGALRIERTYYAMICEIDAARASSGVTKASEAAPTRPTVMTELLLSPMFFSPS